MSVVVSDAHRKMPLSWFPVFSGVSSLRDSFPQFPDGIDLEGTLSRMSGDNEILEHLNLSPDSSDPLAALLRGLRGVSIGSDLVDLLHRVLRDYEGNDRVLSFIADKANIVLQDMPAGPEKTVWASVLWNHGALDNSTQYHAAVTALRGSVTELLDAGHYQRAFEIMQSHVSLAVQNGAPILLDADILDSGLSVFLDSGTMPDGIAKEFTGSASTGVLPEKAPYFVDASDPGGTNVPALIKLAIASFVSASHNQDSALAADRRKNRGEQSLLGPLPQ